MKSYIVSMSIAVDAPDMGSAVLRVSRSELWPDLLNGLGATYLSLSVSDPDEEITGEG